MSSASNVTHTILDDLACLGKKEVEKFSSRLKTMKQERAAKYVDLIACVEFPSTCASLEGPCTDPDVIATFARHGWGYQAHEKVQPYKYAFVYNPRIVSGPGGIEPASSSGNAHAFPELDARLFECTTIYLREAVALVVQSLGKAEGRNFTVSTSADLPEWVFDIYSKVFEGLGFTKHTPKMFGVELLEN